MGKQHPYTNEVKIRTVMSFITDHESVLKLSRELAVDHSVVLRWVRKYEHGGIEELTKETRGRKGRPKNAVFNSVEEELEQVKMERDLLKKVSTLRKKLIKR